MTSSRLQRLQSMLVDELPRLRRYARALTRDLTASEDLVQDAAVRALDKLHLWEDGTDFRAWTFTILHNQYVNHIRKAVRETNNDVHLDEGSSTPLWRMMHVRPDQVHRIVIRDLERAMKLLPEEQRVCILMAGVEGLKYEEIAELLEIPVGTVRSRLSRGRDLLRSVLEDGTISPTPIQRTTHRYPRKRKLKLGNHDTFRGYDKIAATGG